MTEKNFEDFLKNAAKSYNAPPARTPREEMWTAIQASRSAGPRVVYGGGSGTPIAASKRFGARVWVGAAAAAMLLVATGVGIGRFTARPSAPVASTAPAAFNAEPIVVANGGADNSTSSQGVTGSGTTSRESREPRRVIQQVATASEGRTTPRSSTSPANTPSVESPSVRAPSSAYQLTTMQHLSEAEALLTSFRTRSPADQQMDAQLGAWARQLLSNTRLLLDSPVANDPQRRPLLEDLELVLVQIVQLSPASTPQDRELIEKTLQQDHVMTRLRTAIPAGPQRGS
jgi:hypothetical protein